MLTHLSIVFDSVLGINIIQIGFAQSLKSFRISEFSLFKSLSNLKKLLIPYCTPKMTTEGFSHISLLTSLEHLDIYGCPVTDEGLYFLKNLNSLKELEMYECNKVSDSGLRNL